MNAQGISRYYRDHPYDVFTAPVREVIRIFVCRSDGPCLFLWRQGFVGGGHEGALE